ncbi:hypothetical protein IOD40_12690 [Aquamicrobium sp. cd-1]|uniref:Uncharacterized protein n=1 Tax=Aquamicrobium zhengzhouense TaxID=2781738 RepID=A0ABS0SE18_9HYPH|nr:hypothetical protein [Aquamicrobium zhengzhouense]
MLRYSVKHIGQVAVAVATICVSYGIAGSAQAAEHVTYRLTQPVIEEVKFNGIEARAAFALTPPDVERPLTDEQLDLIADYRDLEDACRGGRPGPETDDACAKRDTTNLRESGICWGLKQHQSMAEMEWHACRVSSNEYDLGSERLTFACVPGEKLSLSLEVFQDEVEQQDDGSALIKLTRGTLTTQLSRVTGGKGFEYPASLRYEFEDEGALVLRELYDGNPVVLPTTSSTIRIRVNDSNTPIRDEIAQLYAICK